MSNAANSEKTRDQEHTNVTCRKRTLRLHQTKRRRHIPPGVSAVRLYSFEKYLQIFLKAADLTFCLHPPNKNAASLELLYVWKELKFEVVPEGRSHYINPEDLSVPLVTSQKPDFQY